METMPPTTEAPPPASSLFSRLFNVFAAPGEVFDEVKSAQASVANWLVPTLLVAILGALSALVVASQASIQRQKAEMQEVMFQKFVESGKMSQQQADDAIRGAQAAGSKQHWEAVGVVVVSFISLFWSALIIWLGGIILGTRFGYMRAVEIVGLAGMIAVLGVILKTLLILVTGNMFAGPHPGLFVKDFSPVESTLDGVLAVADVIWFWALGVQACGLARLGNMSFTKAAIWVFGVWLALMGAIMTVSIAVRRLMGF